MLVASLDFWLEPQWMYLGKILGLVKIFSVMRAFVYVVRYSFVLFILMAWSVLEPLLASIISLTNDATSEVLCSTYLRFILVGLEHTCPSMILLKAAI